MKHILIPVDFSPEAISATRYALEFASHSASELVLLTVFEAPLLPPASTFVSREMTEENAADQMVKSAVDRLKAFAEEHIGNRVPTRFVAIEGKPTSAIAQFTKDHNVDLVVLGTKGATWWGDRFQGTVSSELMRRSDVPCLIIPAGVSWNGLKNWVFATELRSDETPYFAEFTDWGDRFDAHLTYLHIHRKGGIEHEPHPALNAFLEGRQRGNSGQVRIEGDHVQAALEQFIDEQHQDLLAVTTQTHTLLEQLFHRSLARHEALHGKVPLMVFHRKRD